MVRTRKENKMAKQLLPNGSVVTLKGATKKLMTIGIEVEMEGDEKPTIISQFPIRRGISIRKPCFFLCRRISKMYLS